AGFGDIRPTHANVFPFVPDDGISVSALAARALVRKQTMAQSVDELEQLGYVERRPNPNDRRSRLVFLTKRGASVRPLTLETAERVENGGPALTSRAELEALRGSLLHLLTAVDATQVEGAAWQTSDDLLE